MHENLRNQLVEQQPRSRSAEERFQQEINQMMEKKLTPIRRMGYGFGGLLSLSLACFFGYYAWTAPAQFPLLARLGFITAVLFGLIWFGMSLRIVIKGVFHIRRDENMANGLTWGFMVIMITMFMLLGGQMKDQTAAISMVLNGLVFFVAFAIPAFINMRVNRMELGLREQLLKMELTLAQITEDQDKLATRITHTQADNASVGHDGEMPA
jgi:predicted lysophospholipase L1 biosynthesis ABC-type transport system permease subunit